MPSGRLVAIVALAGVAVAYAGPSAAPVPVHISAVAGTLGPGQSMLVTGSGFGVKTIGAPVKYDDFEAGSLNTTVANGWEARADIHPPQYSNVRLRPNSTRSARCDWPLPRVQGDDGVNLALGVDTPWPRDGGNITQLYLDAWYYLDSPSPYMRNHKLWRLHTGRVGSPNLYANVFGSAAQISDHLLAQDGLLNAGNGYTQYWGTRGLSHLAGRWSHLQVWVKESSVGQKDGWIWASVDGTVIVNGAVKTRDTNTHWNSLWIGNYLSSDNGNFAPITYGISTYWDNVYVDNSVQRVEIGDQPYYSNCSHREVQVPSAWSDDEITVTLNAGSFPDLKPLYLFVVGPSGTVSEGYPLWRTVPAAPTGVVVR